MQITIKQYVVSLERDIGSFSAQLSSESMESGLERIHLRLESATPERPPLLKLTWSQEAVGIHGVWDTDSGRRNNFIGSSFTSKSTSNAPVISLFNMNGDNRLTFAFSDALNSITMVSWINEETAAYDCSITLFAEVLQKFAFQSQYARYIRVFATNLRQVAGLYRMQLHELEVYNNVNNIYALMANANNRYVANNINAQNQLIAQSTAVGDWEKFNMIDLGNGNVALKSMANNL